METARTFISVEMPMTDAISSLLDDIRNIRGLRASNPSQIHLTMAFLGDIDRRKIPVLCDNLTKELEGFGTLDLICKGMGAFPKKRDPRVVWIGFEDNPSLIELSDRIRKVLDSMGFDYDRKRFSPHVTVARSVSSVDATEIIDSNKDTEYCRFTCDSIRVMTSILSPKGAKHSLAGKISLL